MNSKRITIFCGHYGSGKTNIAVNYALELKKEYDKVSIIDLDIVNPYFRTKDSEKELIESGVELICSDYAGSNLDIPALPASMARPIADQSCRCVMDIGGDDRGAVALGRFADSIREQGDYEMLFVVSFYRPLTQTAEAALEVMREIEAACSVKFTGIVNNSNVGPETTLEDIENTFEKTKKLCSLSSLPLVMTAAREDLANELSEKTDNVFPLKLQKKIFE